MATYRIFETLRALPGAFAIVARQNYRRLLISWLEIPLTVLTLLVYVWAVNLGMTRLPFTFPASVTCLLFLFVLLLLSSAVLGRQRTAVPLRYLEPTSDFLLKWISLFFCPAFVLLPVSEMHSGMTGIEIGKIIALFVVSFLLFIVLAWVIVKLCNLISPFGKKEHHDMESTEDNQGIEVIKMQPNSSMRTDTNSNSDEENARATLQINEPKASSRVQDLTNQPSSSGAPFESSRNVSGQTLVQEPQQEASNPNNSTNTIELSPLSMKLAENIEHYLTLAIYVNMFLISLPIFYTTAFSTPLFLSTTILAFFFAAQVMPASTRRILHPIITCAVLTVLSVWCLGLARGWSLEQSLRTYTTGTKYLVLFDPARKQHVPPPGAGDILSSVLDASIVSLAVPMYRYRGELKRHAFELFGAIIPLAVLSVFIYPLAARAITLAPSRALAFAARSVTTPLALPMEASLAGDTSLTVILCILTGVLGALAGPPLLRVLRVKDSDFITIGIVLGCTASAISTAALIGTNPRAAAISSIAFVLYGVVCVVLSSIPPVVVLVQRLAGA